ncbi:MAG TPA: aminoacyl--tRNA ligase-related protein [Candidatus Paceibacterota bacterium]
MLQSQLFTKTRKEAPKDEVAKNAQLLIRAGYIHKEMAGVYSYLPLGLRVMNNIVQIIREEMNAIGGEEVALTALQDRKIWETTGRWSDDVVSSWFKTKLKNGSELGLSFTHEEPLTALMRDHIHSYRDLPRYVYQFQTKFRNEERAKSGIMRGREFLMKDLYSFSKNLKDHEVFYEKVKKAYVNIWKRLGLGDKTYVTFASGGSFSKYSHEFQTVDETGEDVIYVDEKLKIAVNKEVLTDDVLKDLGLNQKSLVEKRAVEVGNIFNLGTRFSSAFELTYVDESGNKKPVVMGSYGIGPGRVMGAIIETLSDENGIVWPKSVAPFRVHLILVEGKDRGVARKEANELYELLSQEGIETLYDDRDIRAGEKFADADLIGIPWRIVISEKTITAGAHELKNRATGKIEHLAEKELIAKLK